MAASTKYCAPEDSEQERPVKVSAEAGRKCVRSIYQHPILSQEWAGLVDQLRQLSRLVNLEGRIPVDAKVAQVQGRNMESGGTLWDQGAHENAIRILVEEAKVNLCLRMINDYKKWWYGATRQGDMKLAVSSLGYHEIQVEQLCMQYEESLGLLLERAFEHVETLQLIDIPLLVEHCGLVLDYDSKAGPELFGVGLRAQEFMVLFYFASLMRHSDTLKNPELLQRTRDFRLVPLVAHHILTYSEKYTPELSAALCGGLSAMADNEDFDSAWEDFFASESGGPDPEARRAFVRVEEKLVSPLLAAQPDKRRELRPLLDLFGKMRRNLG